MIEMPDLPSAACACWSPEDFDEVACVCGQSERVLRAIQRGDAALNDAQREWCLQEIEKVEGYSRDQYAMADDLSLAHGVLCAWTDYARDKGLM